MKAVALLALSVFMLLVALAVTENSPKRWAEYAPKHNCYTTGAHQDLWFMASKPGADGVVRPSAQVITQTEWRCDSGTVWR